MNIRIKFCSFLIFSFIHDLIGKFVYSVYLKLHVQGLQVYHFHNSQRFSNPLIHAATHKNSYSFLLHAFSSSICYKRLNFFIYTAYSKQVKRSQPLNSSRRGLYLCSSADQNPRTINENGVNSVDLIDFMSLTQRINDSQNHIFDQLRTVFWVTEAEKFFFIQFVVNGTNISICPLKFVSYQLISL